MLSDRNSAKDAFSSSGITKHKRQCLCLKKAGEISVFLLMYISLFLSALAISVVMCAQNSDLYFRIQERCLIFEGGQAEDKEAVQRMNRAIVDFLSGKAEKIDGVSERAGAHMQDVKRIFDFVKATLFLLILFSVCVLYGKRFANPNGIWILSLAPVMLSLALLLAFAFSDFTELFTRFHEIAFTNDLWLLNPAEDLLIRCLPEQFFFEMALIAFGIGIALYGLMAVCAITIINKFGRRDTQ